MAKRLFALLLTAAMIIGMIVMPAAAEKTQTTAPSASYEADVWYEASSAEHLLAYLTNRPSANGKSINSEENKGKTIGIRQQAEVKALYNAYTDTFGAWNLYNILAAINGTAVKRPLKILTLGHSLAVDSGHMLNLVADAEGFSEEMIIGTLCHSGCPLYRHVDDLEGDRIDYQFYLSSSKTPDQPPVILDDFTMKDAIVYDDWDIIVMQRQVCLSLRRMPPSPTVISRRFKIM